MKTPLASGRTVRASLHLCLRGTLCIVIAALVSGNICGSTQTRKGTKRTPPLVSPRWYDTLPSDASNLFARGRAESKDQQLAIDKAVMAAREEIALRCEEQWTTLLVSIRTEDASLPAADSGWGPVTLTKTRIRQQKAVRKGKTWTAFVIVSLPRSSLHSLLLERLHRDDRWYSQVKNSRAVLRFESGPSDSGLAR